MNKSSGFTLVEVLIVVAIVSILGIIAYPSYVKHVEHGRRLDAQRLLLEQVTVLERTYARTGQYPAAQQMPVQQYYVFAYQQTNGGEGFSISATPQSPQVDAACSVLAIDQQGNKTASAGGTGCWKS